MVVAVLAREELLMAGDADLVVEGLTANESVVPVVFTLVEEPVRSTDAARRGLGIEGCGTGAVPPFAAAALLLIRAASWFSDGKRTPPDFFVVEVVDRVDAGCV